MKYFSVFLPAALLSFLTAMLLVFFRSGSEKVSLPSGSYTSRDAIISAVIASVYAISAFWGLGDFSAPESYASLGYGSSLSFSLPDDTLPVQIRYFAGIDPGKWTLEGSTDGFSWYPLLSIDTNYVSVLKWNESSLEDYSSYHFTSYRLSSSSRIEIGELALLDVNGRLITPTAISPGADALFDEQNLVPEKETYLNSSYFDEIYHARTAWESLRCDGMYEITHPPLGKLIIAIGLKLFGVTPFGWRFSGTLCGVLMLPLIYAFLQRMFGMRRVSVCCTLIFAYDFMHFTQTRIATIDSYSVLFILGMYYFMYRFISEDEKKERHLLLSGLFFGFGAASKWTCLYAGAGLAVIWLLYWCLSGSMWKKPFWKNVLLCLCCFVALPLSIYYLSYWPYGITAGLKGWKMPFTQEYLRVVLDNQRYMFSYHSSLVATHPYSSKWYQWILDIRPILYYLKYNGDKRSIIAAFTSPLLCWGGLLAMICAGLRSLRDRRAGFILLGYLAQLLPWVLVSRLTFAYHYFPSELFLVLALGYVLSELENRGRKGFTIAAAVIAVVLFALFYPCLSGVEVSADYCKNVLQWFPSWPI